MPEPKHKYSSIDSYDSWLSKMILGLISKRNKIKGKNGLPSSNNT